MNGRPFQTLRTWVFPSLRRARTVRSTSPSTKARADGLASPRSRSNCFTRWATLHEYITPDCVADFTSIRLEDAGTDRVLVYGIKGKPATEFYKVSISYSAGFKSVGTLVYSWPDAHAKARAADQILRARLERLGLKFDQILTEFVGASATHGLLAGEPSVDAPEVQLRVGVRGEDRASVERFTKEIAPLILTGPPAVTGFAGGRPKVEEIVAYWPALIPKTEIETHVEVNEV